MQSMYSTQSRRKVGTDNTITSCTIDITDDYLLTLRIRSSIVDTKLRAKIYEKALKGNL